VFGRFAVSGSKVNVARRAEVHPQAPEERNVTKRIAVIGAGVSGSACARRLKDRGFDVTVVDKGRSLGGRLATRTSRGGYVFDHGAPSVHADRPAFASVLERLAAVGSATAANSAGLVYGLPSMNALFAPFFDDIPVHQSVEVTGLIQGARGWTLAQTAGDPMTGFDAVAITVPAEQAIRLIIPFGTGWENAIENVRYEPCVTMMVAFEDKLPISETSEPASDYGIAKQIRNSAKPSRPSGADQWVVHGDSAYSAANLEREKDDIAEDLLRRFLAANALPPLTPVYLAGHRWRYARVVRPLGYAHLWDSNLGVGVAGDWCLGANAEHGFESGVVLAETMAAALATPD
jgi:renalase